MKNIFSIFFLCVVLCMLGCEKPILENTDTMPPSTEQGDNNNKGDASKDSTNTGELLLQAGMIQTPQPIKIIMKKGILLTAMVLLEIMARAQVELRAEALLLQRPHHREFLLEENRLIPLNSL